VDKGIGIGRDEGIGIGVDKGIGIGVDKVFSLLEQGYSVDEAKRMLAKTNG